MSTKCILYMIEGNTVIFRVLRYTGFQTVHSWTVNNALWTEGQRGGVLGKVLGGDMPLGL